LPFGPKGVAFAYSAVMVLWALPAIGWAVQGTVFCLRDFLTTRSRPLVSTIAAASCAFVARLLWGQSLSTLPKLVLEVGVLFAIYGGLTWFVTGQKSLYVDLLRGLRGRRSEAEQGTVIPPGLETRPESCR
jgi:hypothetical protein